MNLFWDFRDHSPHADLPAMYQTFVGHELPNELVAAQGIARLLVETATELSDSHRSLLVRLANRLQETDRQSRQLAEMGRLMRGPAYESAWPVGPVMRESIAQMSALSSCNDIIYRSHIEATTLEVSCAWFRRVVRELIHNAQQAIGSGRPGTIETEMIMRANRCTLSVRDTGVGFTEKELATVLDPFQPGRRFRTQGPGLGLFLVRQILRRWKGLLRIESIPGATCVSLEFAATEEE
jgi:signal transduction histidine kinase